jgi:hypothetical protein
MGLIVFTITPLECLIALREKPIKNPNVAVDVKLPVAKLILRFSIFDKHLWSE